MSKSIVAVYHGGRGSGKTLSMSAEGALAMIAGKRVWSNYDIAVNYKGNDGPVRQYKSIRIDMPDLLNMQRHDEIRDGLVLLDEWNLFCNSRRSGSIANVVFSGVVQLIRKRKLCFYITAQDFHTLDRNIRWQADVLVSCFDLSFRYSNLKEGQIIAQRITDWSGVYTGRPILNHGWNAETEAQWARNTRTRLFMKAAKFFGVYDTGFEYDVLELLAERRYQADTRRETIGGSVNDSGGFDAEQLKVLKDMLFYEGMERIESSELQARLNDIGIEGDLRGHLGRKLKAAGFRYKPTRQGNFYYLNSEAE